MATSYKLKRLNTYQKDFSVLDSASNAAGGLIDTAKGAVGGVVQGVGDTMKSGLGRTAAGVGGALLAGKLASGGLMNFMFNPAAGLAGTVAGIGGAVLGSKIAKGVGQGLHNAGNDMKNS